MNNFYKKTKFILITSLLFFCIICAGKTVEAKITKDVADVTSPIREIYHGDSGEIKLIEVISQLISYVLSFLGVIFLSLIIYAGFLWMTAAGDSEKITKAKNILQSSVIGLIIILSSYTVTYFILKNLTTASGTYY